MQKSEKYKRIIKTISSIFLEKILIKIGLKTSYVKTNLAYISWESCLRNLELDMDIVFFGDSITCGSTFHKHFDEIKICNLGSSGDTITNMLSRVGMISAVNPKKIFIMAGINDIANYHGDLNLIVKRYETLLEKIIYQLPNSKIYIESLLPINEEIYGRAIKNDRVKSLNALYENMAKKYNITYINLYDIYEVNGNLPKDFTSDGIHLHPYAYEPWINEIKIYVMNN